jgi:hypothetical protein
LKVEAIRLPERATYTALLGREANSSTLRQAIRSIPDMAVKPYHPRRCHPAPWKMPVDNVKDEGDPLREGK